MVTVGNVVTLHPCNDCGGKVARNASAGSVRWPSLDDLPREAVILQPSGQTVTAEELQQAGVLQPIGDGGDDWQQIIWSIEDDH